LRSLNSARDDDRHDQQPQREFRRVTARRGATPLAAAAIAPSTSQSVHGMKWRNT
jgi:hypothetical protein